MTRAIELIERDITALQEAIRAIARSLQNAYASYCHSLGTACTKQLILASYYLCTQGYPEKFLNLSLNQRQKLQQGIRNLGTQGAELLSSYLQAQGISSDQVDEEVREMLSESSDLPMSNVTKKNSPPDLSNPMEILEWQESIEEFIQGVLKNISRETNLLLQKFSIITEKIPEPLLEAAAAVMEPNATLSLSEASVQVIPGLPNLLNLVVEIENEQSPENSKLTQVMAINLRLAEMEFADTKLSSDRKQIRHILVQLQSVGRDYQKKQRERSVAQAESAWRASWLE
ncbi:hypothetical protein NWP22_15370 [Anabaenopsis tanganyikae CS-531]|uniref:Heterocyst differentiation control protein n=1 Tax=Anabaenopsis tanganyikae CS-531 TaxID=2785304 RepID=A0ABT6KH85_9CYAN|nr:hypothetical protein [Anabaenopsis tanganyikae]MDH6107223.1 hypothetical protein [Anabaenopsis tanganyikae CS-531]